MGRYSQLMEQGPIVGVGGYSQVIEQCPIVVRGGQVQSVDGAESYRCEWWEGTAI